MDLGVRCISQVLKTCFMFLIQQVGMSEVREDAGEIIDESIHQE